MAQTQDLAMEQNNFVLDLGLTQLKPPFDIRGIDKKTVGNVSIQNGVMRITGKGDYVLKIPRQMRAYAWDIEIEGKVIFESDLACDQNVVIKSERIEFKGAVNIPQKLQCDSETDVVFNKQVDVGVADIFAKKLVRSFNKINAGELIGDTDYFSNKGEINIAKHLNITTRTLSHAGALIVDKDAQGNIIVEKGLYCDPTSKMSAAGTLNISGPKVVFDGISELNACHLAVEKIESNGQLTLTNSHVTGQTWCQKSGTVDILQTNLQLTHDIFTTENTVFNAKKSTLKAEDVYLLGEVDCEDSHLTATFCRTSGENQHYHQVEFNTHDLDFNNSVDLSYVTVNSKKLRQIKSATINNSVFETDDCYLALEKIEGQNNAIKTKSLHIENLNKNDALTVKQFSIDTASLNLQGECVLDQSLIYAKAEYAGYSLVQSLQGKLKLCNDSKIESNGLLYAVKDSKIDVNRGKISSKKIVNYGSTHLENASVTSDVLLQINGNFEAIKSKINVSENWVLEQARINLIDADVTARNTSLDAKGTIQDSDVKMTGKTFMHTGAQLSVAMTPQTQLASEGKRKNFSVDNMDVLGTLQVTGGMVTSDERLQIGTEGKFATNETDLELSQLNVHGDAAIRKGYLLANDISVTKKLKLDNVDVEVDNEIIVDANGQFIAQMTEVEAKQFTSLGTVDAKASTIKAETIDFKIGSKSSLKGSKLEGETISIAGTLDVGGRNEVLDDYQIAKMPADGDCLFHAITHQLQVIDYRKKHSAENLRKIAVDYMKQNPAAYQDFFDADNFNAHLVKMQAKGEWGGQHEISALANALGLCITVYQDKQKIIHGDKNNRNINLCFNGTDHYDSMLAYSVTQIHAKESLSTDVNAKITGENLLIEADTFTNRGDIDLSGSLKAKGKQFRNIFGGVKAKKSLTLGYDYYVANLGGTLASDHMTVNSNTLNMGLFSGENITTSGFVNVSLGGLVWANNYNQRSLVSLNYGAVLTTPDFSQGLSGICTWSNAKRLGSLAVNNFAPQYAGIANFAIATEPYVVKAGSAVLSVGENIYDNICEKGFCNGLYNYGETTINGLYDYGIDTFTQLPNLRMHEIMPLACDGMDMYKSATQLHSSFQQATKDYDKIFNTQTKQESPAPVADVPTQPEISTIPDTSTSPETQSMVADKTIKFARAAVSIFGGSYMQQGLIYHNGGLEASYDIYHNNILSSNSGAQLGLHTFADNSTQHYNDGLIASDKITVITTEANNQGDIFGRSEYTLNAATLHNHAGATIQSAHTQILGKIQNEKINHLENDGNIAGDNLDMNIKDYTGQGSLTGNAGSIAAETMLHTGGVQTYKNMQVHVGTLTTEKNASIDLSSKADLSADKFKHGGILKQDNSNLKTHELNQTGDITAQNHSAVIADVHNLADGSHTSILSDSVHIAKNLHASSGASSRYENAALFTKNVLYDAGSKDVKKSTNVYGVEDKNAEKSTENVPAKADSYIMHGDATSDDVKIFANDYHSDGNSDSKNTFVDAKHVALGGTQRFEEAHYYSNNLENSAKGEFVGSNTFSGDQTVKIINNATMTGGGKIIMGGGQEAVMNASKMDVDLTVIADHVTLGANIKDNSVVIAANTLTQTAGSHLDTHQAILKVSVLEQGGSMNLINDTGEVFIGPLTYHHVDKNAVFILSNGETPEPVLPPTPATENNENTPSDAIQPNPQPEELPKNFDYLSKKTDVEGIFRIQDGANANIDNLQLQSKTAHAEFLNSSHSVIGQLTQKDGQFKQNNAKVTITGDYLQNKGNLTLENHAKMSVGSKHIASDKTSIYVNQSIHKANEIKAAGQSNYVGANIFAQNATYSGNVSKIDSSTVIENNLEYKDGTTLAYKNSSADANNIHNGSKATFDDNNVWNAKNKITTSGQSAMSGEGGIALVGKEVDPGALTTAKVHIQSENINVNDAIHARGKYKQFKPTQELTLKTNGTHAIEKFDKNEKRNLGVEADALSTKGALFTTGNLFLTSTQKDININHDIQSKNTILQSARDINAKGVDITGTNHVGMTAKNNINLTNSKKPFKGKYGNEYKFKSTRITGGSGEGYDKIGVFLHALNTLYMQHSSVVSTGINVLKGHNGIKTTFDSYVYISSNKKSGGFFRSTRKKTIDTHIGKSEIRGQKNIFISDAGGIEMTATTVAAPDGNYAKAEQSILLKEAIGIHKEIEKDEYLGGLVTSTDRSKEEFAEGVHLIDDKETVLVSVKGDIRGTGVNVDSNKFMNQALNGSIIYDVSKLKHTFDTRSFSFGLNGTTSDLMHLFTKSTPNSLLQFDPAVRDIAQAFQKNSTLGHVFSGVNAAASAYNVGQELCQSGLANTLFGHTVGGFNPSVGFDFGWTTTHLCFETASASVFNCGEIIMSAGGKCSLTGVELNVAGDMTVIADEFNYSGIALTSLYQQTTQTISVNANLAGNVDVGYSQQQTTQRGTTYANAHANIGGALNLGVNAMTLDAASIVAQNATGRAGILTEITRQDTSHTHSQGFGINTSGAVSASSYHAMDKHVREMTRLHAKNGLNTQENPLITDVVNLVGAQVTTDGENHLQGQINATTLVDKHTAHGHSVSTNLKAFIPTPTTAANTPESQLTTRNSQPITSLLSVTATNNHIKVAHQATVAGEQGVFINSEQVQGTLNTDLSAATRVIENKTETLDMRLYDIRPLIPAAPQPIPQQYAEVAMPQSVDRVIEKSPDQSQENSVTTNTAETPDVIDSPELSPPQKNDYGLPEFSTSLLELSTREPLLSKWDYVPSQVQSEDKDEDEPDNIIAPKAFSPDVQLSQLGFKQGGGGQNQLYIKTPGKNSGQYTNVDKELQRTSERKIDAKTEVMLAEDSTQLVFLKLEGNNCPTVEGKTGAYYKAKYEPATNQMVVETSAGVYTRIKVIEDGFDAEEWGSMSFVIDAASLEASMRGKCNVSATAASINGTASFGVMGPSGSVATKAPALNLFGWTIQYSNKTEAGLGAKITAGAGASADVSRAKVGFHLNLGLFFGAGVCTRNTIEVGIDFEYAERLGNNTKEMFENDQIAMGIIEKMKNFQPVQEWEHDYIDDLAEQSIAKSKFKN